jgi:hypothetical protein
MNLKDLAAQPKLIKMTLDDEDIIKEYGEPLDFWTWDKQPIDAFLKMANNIGKDQDIIGETVKRMVLDESGEPIITEGVALPGPVLMKVVNKIVGVLGK